MIEDQSKNKQPEDENMKEEAAEIEKVEEQKLMSKYPQGVKAPLGSQFLQKRLQQRKFFDSGDYNMAKAKGLKLPVNSQKQAAAPQPNPASLLVAVGEQPDGSTSPTGCEIPTPETVPLRKTSIVTTAASKLSPQPLLHHSPTGNNPALALETSG